MVRCPKGTHRNWKTGNCDKWVGTLMTPKKRCPKGTHRNWQNGNCEKWIHNVTPIFSPSKTKKKRCPNGRHKNFKTGNCEPKKKDRSPRPRPSPRPSPSPSPTPSIHILSSDPSPDRIKHNNANVIARFFKKTKDKRTSVFLKQICPDPGTCLAFGKETQKIKEFFNGFTMFEHAEGNIKRLGTPSANGFIHRINYSKNGYMSQAILKSSQQYYADNLGYEYLVGQFLNKMTKCYPCFVETYGLYSYPSDVEWRKFKNTTELTPDEARNSLILYKESGYNVDFKKLCNESLFLSILIQNINSSKSLKSVSGNIAFINNDIIFCFYQIYYVLSQLTDIFTHYDLHNDNIMLYEPLANGYIHYHYMQDNGLFLDFRSPYVVKIIDYGRSFFNDIDRIKTADIFKDVCAEPACIKHCGDDRGFEWLNVPATECSRYFIQSTKRNKSHDLRALYKFNDLFGCRFKDTVNTGTFLKDLQKKLKYGVGIHDKTKKEYGTIEAESDSKNIKNVADAEEWLRKLILLPDIKANNSYVYSYVYGKKKIGDLYIYNDGRPSHFTPTV